MTKLVIVGIPEPFHIGSHFLVAAGELGIDATIIDSLAAYEASWVWQKINWHLRGKRPTHLKAFNEQVLKTCEQHQPDYLLVTGLAPVLSKTLQTLRARGVSCFNFLTDDPWNPAHQSQRYFDMLAACDAVFSPRRANLDDLRSLGCNAAYLPFAYAPHIHFTEPPQQEDHYNCDVMFFGGGDKDRTPIIAAVQEAGFQLRLYGGYWSRIPRFQAIASPAITGQELRWAVRAAKVNLCLVRRANRDGHAMRTFEIPAMGGGMLTEDTPEHRDIFGAEGENTLYFTSNDEMVAKIRILLSDRELRHRLSEHCRDHIEQHKNTYRDRLQAMFHHI